MWGCSLYALQPSRTYNSKYIIVRPSQATEDTSFSQHISRTTQTQTTWTWRPDCRYRSDARGRAIARHARTPLTRLRALRTSHHACNNTIRGSGGESQHGALHRSIHPAPPRCVTLGDSAAAAHVHTRHTTHACAIQSEHMSKYPQRARAH